MTGAAGAIGQAISKRLLKEGYRVAAVDLSEDLLNELFGEPTIRDRLMVLQRDLSNIDDVLSIVPECLEVFGRVDVLVNNAARIVRHTVQETEWEEWENVIAVNQTAPFFLSKAFLIAFDQLRGGRIINISSQAGFTGGAINCPAYAITKGALNTLTKALAKSAAPKGVTVNAISPGIVMTNMIIETIAKEQVEELIESIPVGRSTEPGDIADSVIFLCSASADTVTGMNFDINGGMLMR